MCGIAGVVGRPGLDPERSERVRRITATLIHRGPDGEGYARRDGCDLGFRRLAIVDIAAPPPPFANEDQTIWTICNGEIYNSQELRARLEARGHRFGSRVDTEVIPHLYEEYGTDLATHMDGMFAFAVWDEKRQILVLGRDRAGEKPLFYWQHGGELVFASEMRALLAYPGAPRDLDPAALSRYLLHGFYPAPLTPFAAIRKLAAGHVLVAPRGTPPTLRRYWDLADYFGRAAGRRRARDVAAQLDQLMSQAVCRRKRSDVPVGVFLSGGVDSSAILAYLTEQEGPGVPVFSLGHKDLAFDEARFARRTAEHFKADFDELILDEGDLQEGLRRVGDGLDEPLGDASTIPTHLLSLRARRKVKVILSGEGGDELFAGYPTYAGNRLAELYRRIPHFLRRQIGGLLKRIPASMGNVDLGYLAVRFIEAAEGARLERHHRWFGCLPPDLQRQVLAPAALAALEGDDAFSSARAVLAGARLPDSLAELLYTDFSMYLQDDLLTKVDRATMLASLEARAPFLDHELAEYVAGLPSGLKLRGFRTKAIMRRALRHRLPREILTRRKRGFNVPFSRWLLHGLGEQMRQRFSTERVRARGLFAPAGIAALLDEHLTRRADHRKPLFTLLALDLWCDRTYGQGAAVPLAREAAALPAWAVSAR